MTTDGTGTVPRRAPLAPSARGAGATLSSGGSPRRISNRPPPKSLFDAAPRPAPRGSTATSPQPGSASASANATPTSAADNARALRDEVVRAVMPELRTLVEHLVKTTVERAANPPLDRPRELEAAIERALSPLVAKQAELEATLAELRRAEVRPLASPSAALERAPRWTPSPENVEVAQPPVHPRAASFTPVLHAPPRPVAAKPPSAIAAAHDATASWELPSELNGSRRKRAVIWILAIALVLLLGSVAGLAVLSNMGTHF